MVLGRLGATVSETGIGGVACRTLEGGANSPEGKLASVCSTPCNRVHA